MTERLKSPSVLCAGRLYCDLVFTDVPRMPSMGTEIFAGGLEVHAGGGAFITAVALSTLGARSSLLSVFPAAPFDKITQDNILKHNVDTNLCQPACEGSDPQITVAIASDQDRAFLSRKSGKALPAISPEQMSCYQHLHIGELRTLKEHPELISHARNAGVTISIDCGWDDELMANEKGLSELITQVDLFLPNEMEADRLVELGISLEKLPLTVIKCGAKGARAHIGSQTVFVKTKQVNVVDTTGAGDAFNGGFISKWLQKAPLEECLEVGNMCGTASVQYRGGTDGLVSLVNV